MVLIFSIYRQFASWWMFLRHRKTFHGFVKNSDAMFFVQDEKWRTIVHGLAFVTSKKKIDIMDRVRQRLKKKVFDYPERFPKLTGTVKMAFGYVYLIHDTYTLDDCVKPMDMNILTHDDIRKFIGKHGNEPFPKNDTALWEVFVGTKPMAGSEDGTYNYPILFKVHHVVGDGSSLFSVLIKVLADDSLGEENFVIDMIKSGGDKKTEVGNLFERIFMACADIVKYIIHKAYVVYAAGGCGYFSFYLKTEDDNALYGPVLSGTKVAGYIKEDKEELVPLVKHIKNTVPNTNFTSVVFTAILASMNDFHKRHNYPIPKKITFGASLVMSFRNFGKKGSLVMENNVSVAILEVLLSKEMSLLKLLKEVATKNEFARHTPDPEITHLILNQFVQPFPLSTFGKYTVFDGISTAITNLPGGPRIIVLDGCELTGIVPFLPTRGKCGILFGILTFDNKFHFGVFADEAIVSPEEVQDIAKGFAENIRLLNEEVRIKFS